MITPLSLDLLFQVLTPRHGTLETWVPYVFGQVPQFINDLAEHNEWAANIVWLDFTKYGKLSGCDLNDTCDLLSSILSRKPQHSVAVVISPFLVSERTRNGVRGEIRPGFLQTTKNNK